MYMTLHLHFLGDIVQFAVIILNNMTHFVILGNDLGISQMYSGGLDQKLLKNLLGYLDCKSMYL